jgi:hypothetical protein
MRNLVRRLLRAFNGVDPVLVALSEVSGALDWLRRQL